MTTKFLKKSYFFHYDLMIDKKRSIPRLYRIIQTIQFTFTYNILMSFKLNMLIQFHFKNECLKTDKKHSLSAFYQVSKGIDMNKLSHIQ